MTGRPPRDRRPPLGTPWGGGEVGGALLVTMLTTLLLAGLAGVLVLLSATEEAVEANHRRAVQALYAAEALLAVVVADLVAAPSWDVVLDGTRVSALGRGARTVRMADGDLLDLARPPDAGGAAVGWRPYTGQWQATLVDRADPGGLIYVAAWIADDPEAPAPVPGGDIDDRIMARAVAFGPRRVRRGVTASLVRKAGAVTVATWDLAR